MRIVQSQLLLIFREPSMHRHELKWLLVFCRKKLWTSYLSYNMKWNKKEVMTRNQDVCQLPYLRFSAMTMNIQRMFVTNYNVEASHFLILRNNSFRSIVYRLSIQQVRMFLRYSNKLGHPFSLSIKTCFTSFSISSFKHK